MPKIAASHSAVIFEKKDEEKKRKKKQKRRVISTKLLSLRNAAKNREIRKRKRTMESECASTCQVPMSVGTKVDFGHFRSSELHDDDCSTGKV